MAENSAGGIIEIGISMLVTAVVIVLITISMRTASVYNEHLTDVQLLNNEVAEQRENLPFDDTYVYAQDIVALVMKQQGDKSVQVKLLDSNVYDWNNEYHSTEYKVSAISSVLPKEAIYKAELVKAENDVTVLGYLFTQVDPNTVPSDLLDKKKLKITQ